MKKSVFLSASLALYKKDETDLTDDLKTVEGEDVDDALVLTIFKRLDAEKVTTFKTEATERFNNGIKKGTIDASKKLETKLREVFNIEDTTLKGEELITHIEDEVLPTLSKSSDDKIDLNKLTDKELAKIPAFVVFKKTMTDQLKAKDDEKKAAVEEVEKKQGKLETLSSVQKLADVVFNAAGLALPKDAGKASSQKELLFNKRLAEYDYIQDANGNPIPVDKDGEQLKDPQGNPLDLNGLIENLIESNFEKAEDPEGGRQSTEGQNGKPPKAGAGWTGKKDLTKQEYMDNLLDDKFDADQKQLMVETFSERFQ